MEKIEYLWTGYSQSVIHNGKEDIDDVYRFYTKPVAVAPKKIMVKKPRQEKDLPHQK